jgi:hypothetical protein
MSQLLIQHYLNDLQTLRRVSGSSRESVVREAFKTLLKDWGRSRDLIFIPEFEYTTLRKKTVYPDGALVYALRVPLGYWEAKDEEDNLDDEIEKKFRKGYPQDNIIFEDSREAVLIQNKHEVMRCGSQNLRCRSCWNFFLTTSLRSLSISARRWRSSKPIFRRCSRRCAR